MKLATICFATTSLMLTLGASFAADSQPKLFPITEMTVGPNWPLNSSVKGGFIDPSGAVVMEPTTDISLYNHLDHTSYFAEGLEPVDVPSKGFGYMDTKCQFAIAPQFGLARPFSDGLAAVRDGKHGPPWNIGYIDHTGKFVIPPQFEQAGPFVDGAAAVEKQGDWLYGCIDHTGKWIVPAEYPSIGMISDGMICVGKYVTPRTSPPSSTEPMVWGFFDTTGNQVIGFKFDQPSSFHEGLAAINQKSGGCGYIDKTGSFAIAPSFFMGWEFSEGEARVETKDNHMICIDVHGSKVFEWPKNVTWAEPFSEGLAAAAIPGKGPQNRTYGFVDHTGTYVIPPQYQGAGSFSNGLAHVLKGDESGYIDKTGHFVWKQNIAAIQEAVKNLK